MRGIKAYKKHSCYYFCTGLLKWPITWLSSLLGAGTNNVNLMSDQSSSGSCWQNLLIQIISGANGNDLAGWIWPQNHEFDMSDIMDFSFTSGHLSSKWSSNISMETCWWCPAAVKAVACEVWGEARSRIKDPKWTAVFCFIYRAECHVCVVLIL